MCTRMLSTATSMRPSIGLILGAPVGDTDRYQLPISVKAVLVEDGRACLLLNERDQWELPGGRLEKGETPEACLLREVREEIGLEAAVEGLLDARAFEPVPGKEVFILVYRCRLAAPGEPGLRSSACARSWRRSRSRSTGCPALRPTTWSVPWPRWPTSRACR